MKTLCSLIAAGMLLCMIACSKENPAPTAKTNNSKSETVSPFTEYIIPKGKQFCNQPAYKLAQIDSLCFMVRFDSSAVYTTSNPADQADINKLYGFSDNNTGHHLYSARFGWRWYNNELQIFAYIYNNGIRSWQKLGAIDIGSQASCCIKVAGNQYIFRLNGKVVTMPRTSPTPMGEGYMLYPYFGGNELSPHEIHIWIRPIKSTGTVLPNAS